MGHFADWLFPVLCMNDKEDVFVVGTMAMYYLLGRERDGNVAFYRPIATVMTHHYCYQ